jgi:uncharacterized protein
LLAGCGGGAPAGPGNVTNEAKAAPPAAPVRGLVLDRADLIPPAEEAELADRLGKGAARSGQALVVATLPSLRGRPMDAVVEDLGNRLGLHDGVMLVLALKEREVRIAVGRGALKLLSNDEARRIVTDDMRPDLHANRFDKGILKGADKILSELSETKA